MALPFWREPNSDRTVLTSAVHRVPYQDTCSCVYRTGKTEHRRGRVCFSSSTIQVTDVTIFSSGCKKSSFCRFLDTLYFLKVTWLKVLS